MLTIRNIEKLENQKVNQDWTVSSVYKKASTYSITIRSVFFPYQRIVELSRFVEFNNNGIGHYYFFNEQGRKSHTSLVLEQIKYIGNIVDALNWFTL
jgi:hypothetical protein